MSLVVEVVLLIVHLQILVALVDMVAVEQALMVRSQLMHKVESSILVEVVEQLIIQNHIHLREVVVLVSFSSHILPN